MIAEQRYDVFLSYSVADESTVEFLAHLLSDVGLQVWFDKWALVPGQPWQKLLEEVMQSASAIIMCIGPSGLSPLQENQYQSALSSQIAMQVKLMIPVLLPGVDTRALPYFLKDRRWIDLRNRVDDSRELTRLVSIIAQALLEESLRVALALYGEESEQVAAILSNLGG